MLKPSKLRRGDIIGLIAPCYAVDEETVRSTAASIERQGFSVKLGKNILKTTIGFAALAEERAEDFNEMVKDPTVRMILFTGGEVSNEILPYIDYEAAARNPKIICSYSDGTSVLNAVSSLSGLETFYGQSPGTLCSENPYNRQCFEEMFLNGTKTYQSNTPWNLIHSGVAEGELIGGYLLNFAMLMEGKYFRPDPRKRYILFIEDHLRFNFPPAVSRYFSHIEQSGFLSQVDGLIFGHYSEEPQPQIGEILGRLGKRYQIPIVWCDDFGHGKNQSILPIGVKARFHADDGTLVFLEDPVL